MDRKFQQQQEIQRLILLGATARSCLQGEAVALRERLDVPARVRSSLKHHPTGWLLGSLGAGLAASLLLTRRRSAPAAEKKRRGLPAVLLGLSLTALRPFAKVWLTDQVKHYLAGPRAGPPDHRA
jgi:hypothetical protein